MSTHRAAFDICAALVTADTGAGGLNNTASQAHLFGGFARIGDPQRTQALPYIDMEIAYDREVDAFNKQRVDMIVRFHVFTDRNTAYRTTEVAGTQDTVVAQLRTVFHRIIGGASAGWNANKMYRISGQQREPTDTAARYVETYHLRLSK